MSEYALLVFIAVLVAVKFMIVLHNFVELVRMKRLRSEAAAILKMLKGYLDRVEREHRDVVSEVKPVAEAALTIIADDVRPAIKEAAAAVNAKSADLKEYTREANHSTKDVLQAIVLSLNEVKMRLGRIEGKT